MTDAYPVDDSDDLDTRTDTAATTDEPVGDGTAGESPDAPASDTGSTDTTTTTTTTTTAPPTADTTTDTTTQAPFVAEPNMIAGSGSDFDRISALIRNNGLSQLEMRPARKVESTLPGAIYGQSRDAVGNVRLAVVMTANHEFIHGEVTNSTNTTIEVASMSELEANPIDGYQMIGLPQ